MKQESHSPLQPASYDVVTMGETMLRLTPPDRSRLEGAHQLEVFVGGSESNTAVGLARLGKRVAWLSRLTDNSLGRSIANIIAGHSVDVGHVAWTSQDRVGTYFFENGSPPRPSSVIYDRAGSAYSNIQASDLPISLFVPDRSRWLHITGISLWLTESVRETVRHAVDLAKKAGWRISFDVNHRALLCDSTEACKRCEWLFELADLVFLPRRDAMQLWGLGGKGMDSEESDNAIMDELMEIRSRKPTVMTLGAEGAMASAGTLRVVELIEPVEPIGRLGGGDAFSAGFLDAWIDTEDLQRSLRWACAAAMLKYSIPGDLPIFTRREVEQQAFGKSSSFLIR